MFRSSDVLSLKGEILKISEDDGVERASGKKGKFRERIIMEELRVRRRYQNYKREGGRWGLNVRSPRRQTRWSSLRQRSQGRALGFGSYLIFF